MCACNLLYIQERGHYRRACYCYLIPCCGCFILWGGAEGWGALSNEAPPPHPGNTPTFCPLMDACGNSLGGIISFTFISFGAVPFPLSGSAGPDRSHLTLFCKSAIPNESLAYFWNQSYHSLFMHVACAIWSCLEFKASAARAPPPSHTKLQNKILNPLRLS